MKKTALITGITGQDGVYLSEFLLKKGYVVHGIKRRSSSFNTDRIDHLYQDSHIENRNFILHYGDMTDGTNLIRIIEEVQPDEIYNLAAMSHVQVSSELYGKAQEIPQTEKTPFYPRSPYAVAKMYAYWITVNYREAYGIYACNGILFNHESPIRGETFVTRKITRAVSKIAFGLQEKLYLGNLDAKRDWGHAKDYVRMMWMLMQHEEAQDWVIATGKTTTVRDFVKMAFKEIGVELVFKGNGVNEKGYIKKCTTEKYQLKIGQEVVALDSRYFRPTEVDYLIGDATKAKEKLGWVPKYELKDLIKEMMQNDLKLISKDQYLKEGGYSILCCNE